MAKKRIEQKQARPVCTEEEAYHWGAFKDYCEDEGIGLQYEDDWGHAWRCWKAAIDAHKQATEPPRQRIEEIRKFLIARSLMK
jgi:hypothetical protein